MESRNCLVQLFIGLIVTVLGGLILAWLLGQGPFERTIVSNLSEEPAPVSEPVLIPPTIVDLPRDQGPDGESSLVAVPTDDPYPDLPLPFSDNFDQGLNPLWRVLNGNPLVVGGRLTSATDQLSLELGNSQLDRYTLEMDVGGADVTYCGFGYGNALNLGFSPNLLMAFEYTDYVGRLEWYAYGNDDWERISRSRGLDCGHFRIGVNGASYTVHINGQQADSLVFEPAQGPLLVRLNDGVFIDNFSIRP